MEDEEYLNWVKVGLAQIQFRGVVAEFMEFHAKVYLRIALSEIVVSARHGLLSHKLTTQFGFICYRFVVM